jgi:transcriptional regulator with XRE-family HTH domain
MLADLPTLVKRWRQQLGLIQAQFAREVGAALRRVTPGENAGRGPCRRR